MPSTVVDCWLRTSNCSRVSLSTWTFSWPSVSCHWQYRALEELPPSLLIWVTLCPVRSATSSLVSSVQMSGKELPESTPGLPLAAAVGCSAFGLSSDRPGILQPASVLRPNTAIAAATTVVRVRRGIGLSCGHKYCSREERCRAAARRGRDFGRAGTVPVDGVRCRPAGYWSTA